MSVHQTITLFTVSTCYEINPFRKLFPTRGEAVAYANSIRNAGFLSDLETRTLTVSTVASVR